MMGRGFPPWLAALLHFEPKCQHWIVGHEHAFVEFVLERFPDADAEMPSERRLLDLALVFGCLRGNEDAFKTFDERVLARLGAALAERSSDLRQELVTGLFVAGDASSARAHRYSGRGSLVGWVRTTARNLMVSKHRGAPAEAALPEDLPASEVGPEDTFLQSEESILFHRALMETVQAMSRRDQEVLRLRFVENRPIHEIASRCGVHRETAGLWLEAARSQVVKGTTARLRFALGDSAATARTIEDAIASGMTSIGRILARPPR